jgi:hypothetical protein
VQSEVAWEIAADALVAAALLLLQLQGTCF